MFCSQRSAAYRVCQCFLGVQLSVSAVKSRFRFAVSCFIWTSLLDLRCTCTRGLQVLGATIGEACAALKDDSEPADYEEEGALERRLQQWLAPVDLLSFEVRCLFSLAKYASLSICLHCVSALEQVGHKPDSSDLSALYL